ncbi:hypothetical protein BRADI_2g33205v3 [Brachypodium distachyon]|uniref:Uncharacterized protein n=1 Tax=Brachypodium distachyon TaxID=15368 RepID=A0A2K2DBK4_BRADI|nr:hypothetical protein BRADI_2g33205v3 [Brachypodium distachyon]
MMRTMAHAEKAIGRLQILTQSSTNHKMDDESGDRLVAAEEEATTTTVPLRNHIYIPWRDLCDGSTSNPVPFSCFPPFRFIT